jgi:hypothetical protein
VIDRGTGHSRPRRGHATAGAISRTAQLCCGSAAGRGDEQLSTPASRYRRTASRWRWVMITDLILANERG